MMIQQQACPRCHIRRTAKLFGVLHCFNCRYPSTNLDFVAYPFTARELARLLSYRGAIRAGLYSDWPVYA